MHEKLQVEGVLRSCASTQQLTVAPKLHVNTTTYSSAQKRSKLSAPEKNRMPHHSRSTLKQNHPTFLHHISSPKTKIMRKIVTRNLPFSMGTATVSSLPFLAHLRPLHRQDGSAAVRRATHSIAAAGTARSERRSSSRRRRKEVRQS
jgi:hypothetical protein